jgi:hypothetical protein
MLQKPPEGQLTQVLHKAMIHSTSEEVGMALVVMGKWIAQQCVPNPWRPPKPVK